MPKKRTTKASRKSRTELAINWRAFDYYPALKRIKTHVNDHPNTPLTLTESSAVAIMESTYFSKFFHQKTGICFKDWEELQRVEHAMSYFDTEDKSVTDAALDAGFNDVTTFLRAFKRVTGITPREYKRRSQVLNGLRQKTA